MRTVGFSLFEVLLALAILGIAIAALAQALVNSVVAVKSLESADILYSDIEFTLRQALLVTDREQFIDGGNVRLPDDTDAVWSAEIEDTRTLDLFKVRFQVALPRTEERPEFEDSFTFYLQRSGWMEAIDRASLLTEKKEAREAERFRFR